MLEIRQAQVDRMMASREKVYFEDYIRYIRTEYPRLVEDRNDAVLCEALGDALARARRIGLTSSEAISSFIDVSIAAGEAFHDDPDIVGFLSSTDFTEAEKARFLYGKLNLELDESPEV